MKASVKLKSHARQDALQELAATAHYCGNNLTLVQAAGGNSSVKNYETDEMWVKASGVPMSGLTSSGGIVSLRLKQAAEIVRSTELRSLNRRAAQEASVEYLQTTVYGKNTLRPSLEAGFHAVLPQRVILHTHAVYLNAFTCMQDGRAAARELLPRHTWIPYVAPGFELAVAIANCDSLFLEEDHAALLLENHGFVACGNSAAKVRQLTEQFVAASRRCFGNVPAGWLEEGKTSDELQARVEKIQREIAVCASQASYSIRAGRFRGFQECARRDELLRQLSPLVPDDVVYAGSVIVGESSRAVESLPETFPESLCLAIPGLGFVLLGQSEARVRALEEMLLAQLLVRTLIARRGVPRPLPDHEVAYLASMESEKYRRSVAQKDVIAQVP